MTSLRCSLILIIIIAAAGPRDRFGQFPPQSSGAVEPLTIVSGEAPLVDSRQDARIAELERMLWNSNNASNQPTYPSITVTGFFQADAAWFNQNSASVTAVGDIPDVVDFRRA